MKPLSEKYKNDPRLFIHASDKELEQFDPQEVKDHKNKLARNEGFSFVSVGDLAESLLDRKFSSNVYFLGSFRGTLSVYECDGMIAQLFKYEELSELMIGGYKIELQESYGGEGQGDEYWVVLKITDKNREVSYWKYDGYYASYDGGYLEDVKQVQPKKVEQTIWV